MSTRLKVKNDQENSTDIAQEIQKQLGENRVCRWQVNGGELFQQGPPKRAPNYTVLLLKVKWEK